MSLKVLTKLVALLTALSATVVAIFWLKQGHMNSFWKSLGVDRSGTRVSWCEERVKSVHVYGNGAKLLEKDGKWVWSQNGERTLDYLRVEKWFAQYCQVPVKKTEYEALEMNAPLVEVAFINGERLSIYQFPDTDFFKVRGKIFESETLRKGLKELLAFGDEIQ